MPVRLFLSACIIEDQLYPVPVEYKLFCLETKSNKFDTGYPHDGRADKGSYPHDGRADKDSYPHDGRADKDSYPHDRQELFS